MSPFFLFRFEKKDGGEVSDLLLAYLSTDQLDDAELRSALDDHFDKELVPDEVIVLVREPIASQVVSQFEKSGTLLALKRRVGTRGSISVRGFGASGQLESAVTVHGTLQAAVALRNIIRRGTTRIVRDRNGFVSSAGNYHFALPSLKHTDRFLRISNILVNAAEISFISIGILPFISPKLAVAYIDTPSLFPIVASLSDHLRSFDSSAAPVFAENFSSYSGYADTKFDVDANCIVLISTSSSGGLAQAILDVAAFTPSQFAHLLYLGPPSNFSQVVCDLSQGVENPEGQASVPPSHSAESCAFCAQNSTAVPLVGDNFEFPGPQPIPLLVVISDIQARSQKFFERMVGREVLRVGFGRSNEKMARQFEIEAGSLVDALEASGHLRYALSQAVPLSTSVIVAVDSQSMSFAEKVRTEVVKVRGGSGPQIIVREQLSDLTPAQTDDAVLIVGAVIESGRSLQEVSRDLRRPFPKAPQVYLIGAVKYRMDLAFQQLRNDLVQTHRPIPHDFVPLEVVQLPSSAEANAWVAELAFLNDATFFEGMDDDEIVDWTARRDRLTRQSEPLLDDLFISTDPSRQLRLQSGFVFWPDHLTAKGSQADVFFTIASVFQNLRAKSDDGPGRALRVDLFQQTLLAPRNFGRFSDGIIQACFLRAARPSELNFSWTPEYSREMGRYARRMLESASRPRGEAAVELLMALATQRLQLRPEDQSQLIQPVDGLPTRVERLRRYVEKMNA